jgi:hypothetical protein
MRTIHRHQRQFVYLQTPTTSNFNNPRNVLSILVRFPDRQITSLPPPALQIPSAAAAAVIVPSHTKTTTHPHYRLTSLQSHKILISPCSRWRRGILLLLRSSAPMEDFAHDLSDGIDEVEKELEMPLLNVPPMELLVQRRAKSAMSVKIRGGGEPKRPERTRERRDEGRIKHVD